MTNQAGKMLPLPQGEKTKSFTGVIDTDTVNAFIFQVEQYFSPTYMVDANQYAKFASMLFTDNAAIWLQSQNLDWDLLVQKDPN